MTSNLKDQCFAGKVPSLTVHEVRNLYLLNHTTETLGEVLHLLGVSRLFHGALVDV